MRPRLPTLIALVGLALFTGTLLLEDTKASHAQGAALEWETVEPVVPGVIERPSAVLIGGQQIWRQNALPGGYPGSCIRDLDTIKVSTGGQISYSKYVLAVDSASNDALIEIRDYNCQGPVRYDVPFDPLDPMTVPPPVTFSWSTCCTSSDIVNEPNRPVHVETTVPLDVVAVSPRVPSIWTQPGITPVCYQDSICPLDFGSDGATTHVLGGPCPGAGYPCGFSQPGSPWSKPIDVASATGAATWDTRDATVTSDRTRYLVNLQMGNGNTQGPFMSEIAIIPQPAGLGIVVSPDQPSAGYAASLSLTTPSGMYATSATWEFGDGENASGTYAQHVFVEAGTYAVTARVTANNGHIFWVERDVTVIDNDAPTVSVDWPDPIYQNMPYRLEANASDPDGDELSYVWYLSIADPNGLQYTDAVDVRFTGAYAYGYVRVSDPHGLSAVAYMPFTYTQWKQITLDFETDGPAYDGEEVAFSFTGELGSGGQPSGTYWDFGDGSPTIFAWEPTHIFAAPGNYAVRTWANDRGTVEWTGDVSIASGAPTASFEYHTDGSVASFTDTSNDPNGNVVGWVWDFGDGANSTAQHPQHAYSDGTYTVWLTVTDDDGRQASASSVVTIATDAAPQASFTFMAKHKWVQFQDTSTDDGLVAWRWNFGDGTASTAQNPDHKFAPGTYTVTLTVVDTAGQSASASRVVTIHDNCGKNACKL